MKSCEPPKRFKYIGAICTSMVSDESLEKKKYFRDYYEKNKNRIKERKKKYREENKDKIKERRKDYYQKNKDKVKQKMKKYYQANRDKIIKRVVEYEQKNKEVVAKRKKDYRRRNREKFNTQQKVKIEKTYRWLLEIKRGRKCAACGESNPLVLVFHHTKPNNKVADITAMVGRGFSKKKILREIQKCVVLCQNCHVEEHYKPPNKCNKKKNEMRQKLNEYKNNIGCASCRKVGRCLSFHHRDGKNKVDTISEMVTKNLPWKMILKEVKKCDVMCRNCHTNLHFSKKYK